MTETEGGNKSWMYSLIAVAVMAAAFLAFLGISGGGGGEGVPYNGFSFREVDGLWQTEWERGGQLYVLDFRHHPEQLEGIPVTGSTDIRFQLERVYITIDPSEGSTSENAYVAVAAVGLARKLTDPFEREVTAACTRNETEACETRPIITCGNTNSSVIYLKPEGTASIQLDGNCATMTGAGEDIVRSAEKAIYQWLGIMD